MNEGPIELSLVPDPDPDPDSALFCSVPSACRPAQIQLTSIQSSSWSLWRYGIKNRFEIFQASAFNVQRNPVNYMLISRTICLFPFADKDVDSPKKSQPSLAVSKAYRTCFLSWWKVEDVTVLEMQKIWTTALRIYITGGRWEMYYVVLQLIREKSINHPPTAALQYYNFIEYDYMIWYISSVFIWIIDDDKINSKWRSIVFSLRLQVILHLPHMVMHVVYQTIPA